MTEAAFQEQVLELAALYGWRVAHFRPARTADGGWRTAVSADGAGFPDLVLVRGPELIFAELKAAKGRVSVHQAVWLEALSDIERAVDMTAAALRRLGGDIDGRPTPAVEVHIWKPADFDLILRRLSRARGPRHELVRDLETA